jgi:hypothetical protein
MPPTAPAILNREPIIELAARRRLPAIYAYRSFVAEGLISAGPNSADAFRHAWFCCVSAFRTASIYGGELTRWIRSDRFAVSAPCPLRTQ